MRTESFIKQTNTFWLVNWKAHVWKSRIRSKRESKTKKEQKEKYLKIYLKSVYSTSCCWRSWWGFLKQVLKETIQKYPAFAVVSIKILWCMDHHKFFSRQAAFFLKHIQKGYVFSYFCSPFRNSSCKLFTKGLSFKVDSCLGFSVPYLNLRVCL